MIRTLKKTALHLFRPGHSNNHRSRLLHPEWLTVFAVLIAITIVGSQIFRIKLRQLGFVLGYASDITVDQILTLTNQERSKSGLVSLSLNSKLSNAAAAKASDMFQNQYWAHTSPAGTEPWDFIVSAGYSYRVAGENLARDFSHTPEMVQAWMASPTHRANIMNSRYTEIGLAVVNGTLSGVETTLVVQMFGAPTTTTPQLAEATTTQTAELAAVAVPTSIPTTQPTSVPTLTPIVPTVAAVPAVIITNEPPQTAVLARQVFPTGNLRPLAHIDPLSITKAFGISVVVVLVGTLFYDLYAIGQYHSLRVVGKNIAHILFFSAVTFLLIFYKSGAII